MYINIVEYQGDGPTAGFWRLIQEHKDGCGPHVLVNWKAGSLKDAKANARMSNALIRFVEAR